MKRVLKWILISYLCVTIGAIIWQEYTSAEVVRDLSWSQSPEASITYFFGTKRCSMCKNMETWAREVSQTFDSVTFRTVAWQDDLNKHYVDHYNLLGNALIISFADKGREVASKDLIDIWDVAHDEARYKGYLVSEFKKFLSDQALTATASNVPAVVETDLPARIVTDHPATVETDLPVTASKMLTATKGEG